MTSFKDGIKTGGGQIEYVNLFTVIAWIILFIACINFMNLATARSEKRAREVGVRKVLGAGKKSLAIQFIRRGCVYVI
jgi:putative ABC transport system permease protein